MAHTAHINYVMHTDPSSSSVSWMLLFFLGHYGGFNRKWSPPPTPRALVFWVLDPYFVPFWYAVEILEHGA